MDDKNPSYELRIDQSLSLTRCMNPNSIEYYNLEFPLSDDSSLGFNVSAIDSTVGRTVECIQTRVSMSDW